MSGPGGARKGLGIIRPGGLRVYRVASSSWGPLNPPARPASLSEVDRSWARFDVPGGQTVYAGETPAVSLAEVLAYFRLPIGKRSTLEKDAHFLGLTDEELAQIVDEEWRAQGNMPPGHIARSWRATRLLHTLTLPEDGWWVQLDDMHTLGLIEENLAPLLRARGIDGLTVSHVTGEDRVLTVTIANWLYRHVARDGTRPHGIAFPSKHEGGTSYAYWMRRVNEGGGVSDEPIKADAGREIFENDPDLLDVAGRFKLRIH